MATSDERKRRAQREDRAIEAWCTVVARFERSSVTVVERPDRDSDQGGCDAIVERGGARQAVEHTTLDSYERRREDDERFRKVVLPVAEVIERTFSDSWIELEIPVHAIPSGENWRALSDRLGTRCIEAVSSMPIADYYDLTRTRFDWDDVPFPVWISRQPTDTDAGKCVVFRQTPGNLRDQRAADLLRALAEKAMRLSGYKRSGRRTVLLLDFDDVALSNREIVADAFARAATEWKGRGYVDEVYLVDTGRRPPWVYPLKLGDRMYPDLPEFQQYFSEQFRVNYNNI